MGRRVLSGILSVVGGKLGTKLLGVVMTPLLVRIIGAEQYGHYAVVLSVMGIATILVHLGTSAGLRKYIAEDRSGDRWQEQVFAFYFRFATVVALLAGGATVLIGLYGPVDRVFGERFPLYFTILGVVLLFEQFVYVLRYTLMGLHVEQYSEPLTVVRKGLYVASGLSVAYLGYGVAGLLVAMVFAAMVTAVIAAWVLRERLSITAVLRPVSPAFPRRQLLSFNVQNTVFVLLTASLYHTDVLLLQPLAGSRVTGFYKAALVVAEFVWLVPIAVQTVFIHSASELWSEGREDDVSLLTSRATRYTLSFSLLLVIGLAGLSREFVSLYFGPAFLEASTALLFLLPGVLGFAVARPIYAVGQARGEFRVLIYATGTAAVLNLCLNVLLIPRYGVVGAAVATSIGYSSMVLLHVWCARQIGFDPVDDLRADRIAAAGVLTAIVVFGLGWILESSIVALVVVPPVGFLVYALATVKLGVVHTDELRPLGSFLPQPAQRAFDHALTRF